MWKVGDLVVRPSYGRDVCFVITRVDLEAGTVELKGLDVRLVADAPFSDLMLITEDDFTDYRRAQAKIEQDTIRLVQLRRQADRDKNNYRSERSRHPYDFFERPGRVLHLDGDGTYLEKCIQTYRRLGVRAVGKNLDESTIAERIPDLLEQYAPDILVITGHDSVMRKQRGESEVMHVGNYRNSEHFVRAVRAARKYERSLDELVIFAGACQSHYEALLDAGANFASSPDRIMIHALDPVFVAEKVAFTPIGETIDIYAVVQSTITGTEGLGGLESRGKYRMGLPRSRY
ncbi:sporulation peptidase YabG [Ferroacidibacillus organovorans]|uniref:Sporulation peptidase YabG n=1 Tax=Ferroacidibacillus organovorans TaxID=1765683 RepID=A0A168C4K4_9BACL|nr:sporulation peptidase YabG [Ferroacidibacillus organovorans]KYP81538.1 sporulation peptidase YabG [Ferroacidibacillus organovorans]OAG94079.1 sporulation peptidase YabG [Ferroacidibacillus organovorans]OPG16851.1 sporulation peptidase YabG [Ferroacidibacillus organovorans]